MSKTQTYVLHLPKEVHKQLKMKAVVEETSMAKLINEAIAKTLSDK